MIFIALFLLGLLLVVLIALVGVLLVRLPGMITTSVTTALEAHDRVVSR